MYRLYSFCWSVRGAAPFTAETREEALDIIVKEIGLEGPNQKIPDSDSITIVLDNRRIGKIDAYERDGFRSDGPGKLRDVSRSALDRELAELERKWDAAPVSKAPGRPRKPNVRTRIREVLSRWEGGVLEGSAVSNLEADLVEALSGYRVAEGV